MNQERLPPHDRGAERGLLGAMLRDPKIVPDVVCQVRPGDFYVDAHNRIFESIATLADKGKQADLETVYDWLARKKWTEDVGGAAYLGELQDAGSLGLYRQYAEIIRKYASRRNLIQACGELQKDAYDLGIDEAEMLAKAERRVLEIGELGTTGEAVDLQTAVYESYQRLDARRGRKEGEINGVPTGFIDLDTILCGFQKSELVIIGARPSTGKTAYALAIARHAAVEENISVLFVSLEQARVELAERMLCAQARIDSHKLRRGHVSSQDQSDLVDAGDKLSRAKFFIDDAPSQNMLRIGANARRMKRQHDIKLIVIDYLQLIVSENWKASRQEQVADSSRRLKALARELQVPVIACCQVNRGPEGRTDKRPLLSDLRECLSGKTLLIDYDTGRQVFLQRLKPGQKVLGLSDSQKITPGLVEAVWKTGTRATFRLTTQTGRVIECTKDHPFLTHRGWVEFNNLLFNDRIAVAFRAPVSGTTGRDDACRLLGYMAGNGSAQKHRTLGLIIPDDVAFGDASRIIKTMFPEVTIHLRNNGYNDAWISRTFENGHGKPGGNPMINWLDEIGMLGCRDSDKHVPEFVYEAGVSGAAHFLAGYLATDGCVKKRQRSGWEVHFDTTSFRLAQDTANLCARIGVLAGIGKPAMSAKGTKPIYRVSLSSEAHNIRRFRDIVPVVGYRADLLATAAADIRDTRAGLFLLPSAISAMASQVDPNRKHQGKWMNRVACEAIAIKSGNRALLSWSQSDVVWERIREIESAGEQDVYDVRIAGIHNFLGNGIVVHNSGAIEADADTVLLMHRDRDNEDVIEIVVAKQRNGPTGEVKLMFVKRFQRFENYAVEHP